MSATDTSLLQLFVEHRCEDSFATIVSRHINLVYSAALRQVGDAGLAEDVVQSVFTDLARSAERLGSRSVISAWLYQVTRRTAIDLVRREARRVTRERMAMQLAEGQETTEPWASVAAALDAAMMRLSKSDQTALVVRFFENRSLHEVGLALGVSEDAAQKRIQRALDRLRTSLRRSGIASESASLGVLLAGHAASPAPSGLAGTIAATAFSQGIISMSIPVAGSLLTMTSSTKTAVAIAAAAALLTIVHQFRGGQALHRDDMRLRSELTASEASRLSEREEASTRLNALEAELQRLRSDSQELLRLRGSEAARLRNSKPAVRKEEPPEAAAASYYRLPARDPGEALERLFRASLAGDETAVGQFSSWRRSATVPDEIFEAVRQPNLRNLTNTLVKTTSLSVITSKSTDPDRQRARVECVLADGQVFRREMDFLFEDGQWKPAFVVERSPAGSFSVTIFQVLTPELGPTD